MNYNLQIQKLLLKLDTIASAKDKLGVIKQAISIADANNDIEWGFDLRIELIDIESDTQYLNESIPAFTWILDAYDNNYDLFDERDFLWRYKWMLGLVRRNPNISLQQIYAILEDFKMRLQRNGYSLRTYYQAKVHLAFSLENFDEARVNLDLADKELKDNMSNCPACELDDKVELELRLGNFEKALSIGADLFSKKLTCVRMPFVTYCNCVEYFTKAKNFEKAYEFFTKAEEDLLSFGDDPSQLSNVSDLIHFLSYYDKDKAWQYFEQHVDWTDGADDLYQYTFARNILQLLKNEGQRKLNIKNTNIPWYNNDNIYDTKNLYNYYYNLALGLAKRFDARNENSVFTEKLTKQA